MKRLLTILLLSVSLWGQTVTMTGDIKATSSVVLAWTVSVGATSYNVYRSEVNNGPYTLIKNVASTPTQDNAVQHGKTYYYVIRAVNSNGESTNSSQVTAVIP